VLGADEVRHVRRVPRHVVRPGRRTAEERGNARDTHHAARGCTRPDLLVRHVAAVVDDRRGVGVAEHDRRRAGLHDLEAAAPPGVGAVHQQARVVHGGHHAPSEPREPALEVVAAVRDAIVAVVGEVNLAHAKVAVLRHAIGTLLERQGALEIEADREAARVARVLDVRDGPGEHVAIRLRRRSLAKAADGSMGGPG